MGKPQVRPSKAGKYAKDADNEEEDDVVTEPTSSMPSWLQEAFPDPVSLAAGMSLAVMLCVLALLIWVNSTGSIEGYTRGGAVEVVLLDTEFDRPAKANDKDRDDLLETYAAVDNIERAVQHGNIAGARAILQNLVATKTLTDGDKEALAQLIDAAEALNPIADIAKCRVQGALEEVEEKGGKLAKSEGETAVMLADFDQDQEEADGRGRGMAALVEMVEGDMLVEAPLAASMSVWAAASSPTFAKVLKSEKLYSFNGLALFLLHESHNPDSPHRKYLCSLPLHVPLPVLWADADLPPDFLADKEITQDRAVVRELVDYSFNITVPAVLEKYPDLFTEEQLTAAKWAWACTIVLSRALPLAKSFMGAYSLQPPPTLDPAPQLAILKGEAKETATHVLYAGVDMLNHESSSSLACSLSLRPDGTAAVATSPSGLKRGYEIAISYGDHLCGTKPLNRYGFVLPACPGDEEKEGEGEQPAEGTPAEGEGPKE